MKTISRNLLLVAMGLVVSSMCGCQQPHSKPTNAVQKANAASVKVDSLHYVLRSDDSLEIRLDTAEGREEHVKHIDEDGNIEMPFIGKIKLAGLTATLAQDAVYKKYVPRFHSDLTVTVKVQRGVMGFVYMGTTNYYSAVEYSDGSVITRALSLDQLQNIREGTIEIVPIRERLGDYWLPGEFEKMLEEKRQERKQKKE